MEPDTNILVPLDIKVGYKFRDLEQFECNLRKQCKSKFVQLYKKDARTIQAAKNKKIVRYMDPALKFYSVCWCCVHGGRKFQTRGTGKRKTPTLRKECPAYIQVRIAESGKEFIVVAVNFKHNHIVRQELFKQLPQNRRLPDDVKADAKKLLNMKANKHMLREYLEEKLCQTVTLKDLSNLQQVSKSIKNDVKIVATPIIDDPFHVDDTFIAESRKKPMTSQEKYQQIFMKAKLMSSLASDLCGDEYSNVNTIIDAIINDLQNGQNSFVASAVSLIAVTSINDLSTNRNDESSIDYVQEDTMGTSEVIEVDINADHYITPPPN